MTADADPNPPTNLDDRRPTGSAPAEPTPTEAISPEPLVEPPSPTAVPLAMLKERGWIAAVIGLFLVGLVLAWRRSQDS